MAIVDVLDCMPLGVIVVDAMGKVICLNAAAREIVAVPGGLRLRDDRVGAETADETKALRELISAAQQNEGDGQDRSGAISLSRRHPLRPVACWAG